MARIYVSSTFKDLKECREKVRQSLRMMGHEDIVMEYYVAQDKRPLDKCLKDVASCDLYIGIFAWRYGFVPKGDDKSITELEYRKAAETGKYCLLFLLHEDAPWPRSFIDTGENLEKIEALRSELSTEKVVSYFKSADELTVFVVSAVHNWENESRNSSQESFHILDTKSVLDKIDKSMDGFQKIQDNPVKSQNDNKFEKSYSIASFNEEQENMSINYEKLLIEANILHSKRISGKDVSKDFSELIIKIETLLSTEHNTYELQSLLSQAYHQYAISLQNYNNSYFQAKLMLLHACTIRSKSNDPEYIISLFQLFMNAYQASEKNNWDIDDLAPEGWRKWMFNEMEVYSQVIKKAYRYDLYHTNLHNLGFLCQFLAENSIDNKISEGYINSAIKYYNEALRIRLKQQDMRLASQTAVKIIKTYLLLIKCLNAEITEKMYSQILTYINYIKQFYSRFPQETFRHNDLAKLEEELYKCYIHSTLKD